MPADPAARRPYQPRPHRRERRTNSGIPLPRAADGRSVSARRFRDLVVAFELEVCGVLTEFERAMIKQVDSTNAGNVSMPNFVRHWGVRRKAPVGRLFLSWKVLARACRVCAAGKICPGSEAPVRPSARIHRPAPPVGHVLAITYTP